MRIFLPVAAVAVGLADALLYSAFGDSPWGGPFVWNIEPGPQVAAHLISAVVAGLIVSGALLLFADRWLRGSFFARYLLMWAAICAGGAILGVLLHGSIIPLDERGRRRRASKYSSTSPSRPRREASSASSKERTRVFPSRGCSGCSEARRPCGTGRFFWPHSCESPPSSWAWRTCFW